ncbi:SRPBCC domain-containing protein [Streptomyces sp. NPDC000594]|uniref:SRPBCC domain-containing protein n=1 Tax=Streptomyces sp. NPDC000594 TaxID=3154261 RepID=UPI0033247CF8
MRRISSTVHIDADPHAVWAVLTAFDLFHAWNPFLVRGSGTALTGARLSLRMRRSDNGRETGFTVRVLRSDPPRLLRWRGRLPFPGLADGIPGLFDGVHTFELRPEGGGTRVLQEEVFTGALVPFTAGTHDRTVTGFTALTDALKVRVESPRATG